MRNRTQIILMILSAGLLFFALCKQYFDFCLVEQHISKQREMQYFSVLFAEDLEKSADEMTRMARCYIATGDPRYLAKFRKASDIHNGLVPREAETAQSLLSVFREDGICPAPFDKPMKFMEIAKRAGFSDREFDLLERANAASDKMGEVANAAIRKFEEDPEVARQRLRALQMLVSEDYLMAQDEVAELIHAFQGLVAERTGRLIDEGEQLAGRIRYTLIGLGLLFSAASFGGMLLESRRARVFHDHANKDPLTNLASRSYLHEHLSKVAESAEAHGEIVLLAFVDLNGFKPINDRFGHRKGDELLKLVADSLRAQCRMDDFVARYGGDEFVIVFVSAMLLRDESIVRMRDTVRRAFDQIHRDEIGSLVGAAVGISVFPCPAPTVDELIRTADKAMYEAKGKGGAVTWSVHEEEIGVSYVDRNPGVADES